MTANEKQVGACAAVLLITGADLVSTVIAILQLGGDPFWWLRLLTAGGFVFLSAHLYIHGPRLARVAAALIGAYIAVRLLVLLQLFSVSQLVGFVFPTAIHVATFIVLIRLYREHATDSKRA